MLQAATELVAERGWDRVTTRQIAERAGVNQALIHYHFGSKERLLTAAVEATLRDAFRGPVEALVAAPRLADGAAELVRFLSRMDQSDPALLFGMEALSRAARDATVRRAMADVLAESRVSIADRIREGQRTGEVDPRLDPEGAAGVLAALFDGLGLHLLVDPGMAAERVAAAVATLLDGGSPPRAAAGDR
jgi:AcrR family transcriptional regulator